MGATHQKRPHFNFDNSFARTFEDFYVSCRADPAAAPKLLQLNHALAEELGLDAAALDSEAGLAIFSGNAIPEGAEPLAQAYAGHQFGGYASQLGDGRALLLGEVIDTRQRRRDIQLKGSGPTPFSRGGDGKAPLGPVLREYLIGEAMHALGIPTTRALAAVSTGDAVYREIPLPGAVLTRVAASHLRVGTFQFFAARGGVHKVRELAEYAIARHYPGLAEAENPFLAFFAAVADAQASLVARWMNVGFIHGVMNTDNMAISGETLDYGPCAFMDTYAPGTVFSSIDRQGRYAYGNQPAILSWNLTRFAETLVPLVDPVKDRSVELLTDAIQQVQPLYEAHRLAGMRSKIGLTTEEPDDLDLVNDLLWVMKDGQADFTLFFRRLSRVLRGESGAAGRLLEQSGAFEVWARRWRKRLAREGIPPETQAEAMDRVNPIYIPRNHKVEEALAAAVQHQDMGPFSKLLSAVSRPFDEAAGNEAYTLPAPVTDIPYQTFCGT
ncbi:MAG: YdiU family protein [Nitrospinaceae bacterium]|nr:YdiU family protein [Nitrospinaceae bacterium]NIR57743.1 YdiU family protein [Nitrospinaceae bacterium]NIS88203.1 YdiU family protein [Nitrospinaceae bacterium]NIT85087.1 YdiU family protein [Nitrospinaceae bacterium]NIU47242.1 YdiU family protein [Nitrospinaceae bacterium]